jgi:hypothetical protein
MPFTKGHTLWKHPNAVATRFKAGSAGHSIPHSQESRLKMSRSKMGQGVGEKNGSWKGGITPLLNKIKRLTEYKTWQTNVLKRDNYTCRKCLRRGGSLTAHHINAFSFLIQVFKIRSVQDAKECFWIWNIRNGVTLCDLCHEQTSNFAWRAVRNPKDRAFYPKIVAMLVLVVFAFPSPSHALTFGYTSQGANLCSIADDTISIRKGRHYVAGVAGTLSKISAYIKASGSFSVDEKAFLNSEDSGGVGTHNQVATKEDTAIALTTTVILHDWTMAGEAVAASTNYIPNIIGDDKDVGAFAHAYVMCDLTTNDSIYSEVNTYASTESPWVVTAATNNNEYSIYATYTASGGATTTDRTRRGIIGGGKTN